MNMLHERPTHRRLRGYAFDPLLSTILDTVDVNNIVYRIRWEEPPEFGPGPVGEYVEVIDYDPTTRQFYAAVDLNHPYLLANDGLTPSESDPQFHQQMVYAVAMLTIENFERSLGRKILWAPRLLRSGTAGKSEKSTEQTKTGRKKYEEYVQRLRIYPHAIREANAYYSPMKKAVLCGYFAASPGTISTQMPGSLVFTCLSHDILAHELTHAILDGLHRNYNRPTNPDVLAFHEAFADVVALFQHFSFPEVLKHQIARTRGDLEKQNLLGQLAQQFGTAIGSYGSLRDALGSVDEKTKEWAPKKPHPADYQKTTQPHQRGSILVAAVFEAFVAIYKMRVKDLLRIASGGTGNLPVGELHPDLVNRLAEEAAKTADHVLSMCIRAIDYCPPVDVTFGDFLRAIITADHDLVSDDPFHYRLAFIDAFRKRGIYPEGIRTLSVESLRYSDQWGGLQPDTRETFKFITSFLRAYRNKMMYETDRQKIYEVSRKFIEGKSSSKGLHERLRTLDNSFEFEKLTGLVFNRDWKKFGVRTSSRGEKPSFQILNMRLVSRVGPDGDQVNQIVVGLVQRMGVVFKDGKFAGHYIPGETAAPPHDGMEIQGGSTLIFDLDSLELNYAISKPLLAPDNLDRGERKPNLDRIERQWHFQHNALLLSMSEVGQYFGACLQSHIGEPFSLLHQR